MRDGFKIGLLFTMNCLPLLFRILCSFLSTFILFGYKTPHIYITDGPISKMLHFGGKVLGNYLQSGAEKQGVENTVPLLTLL